MSKSHARRGGGHHTGKDAAASRPSSKTSSRPSSAPSRTQGSGRGRGSSRGSSNPARGRSNRTTSSRGQGHGAYDSMSTISSASFPASGFPPFGHFGHGDLLSDSLSRMSLDSSPLIQPLSRASFHQDPPSRSSTASRQPPTGSSRAHPQHSQDSFQQAYSDGVTTRPHSAAQTRKKTTPSGATQSRPQSANPSTTRPWFMDSDVDHFSERSYEESLFGSSGRNNKGATAVLVGSSPDGNTGTASRRRNGSSSSKYSGSKTSNDRGHLAGNGASSAAPRRSSVRTSSPVSEEIDTADLERKAKTVMKSMRIDGVSNPRQVVDKFFEDEVKLTQTEKNKAGDSFNRFRNIIMEKLKEQTPWQWKHLNSGSHYDGVKVTRADEMDCMFFPDNIPTGWLEVVHSDAPPEFCFVRLNVPQDQRTGEKYWQLQALCEDGFLNSTKYRQKIFEVFQSGVDSHRHAKMDPDAKDGCPSFMVLLDVVPRKEWRGLGTISIDLLPALHLGGWPQNSKVCLRSLHNADADEVKRAGFHVIPKQPKRGEYRGNKHLLWRFSYSWAEKHLTLHADRKLSTSPGSSPTCRKLVMRILKRMLEIFKETNNSRRCQEPNITVVHLKNATAEMRKEMGLGRDFEVSKFTSFQIRTLMWTEYFIDKPYAKQWTMTERRGRLQDALMRVKDMLAGVHHVQHFFVPDLDIMKGVSRKEREFLYIMFFIAKELF